MDEWMWAYTHLRDHSHGFLEEVCICRQGMHMYMHACTCATTASVGMHSSSSDVCFVNHADRSLARGQRWVVSCERSAVGREL